MAIGQAVGVGEGEGDDLAQRRRRGALAQLPVALLAQAVLRGLLSDPVQRHDGGGAGVPGADPLPQRRRPADEPGAALVPVLARGQERERPEHVGGAAEVAEFVLERQPPVRDGGTRVEFAAQQVAKPLPGRQQAGGPVLVGGQPGQPLGAALDEQVGAPRLHVHHGGLDVELGQAERVADGAEA